jgi:hypothetical protein
METRYPPRLKFKLDSGVKRSIEIARVLSEVLPAASSAAADASAEGPVAGPQTSAEPVGTVEGENREKPEELA